MSDILLGDLCLFVLLVLFDPPPLLVLLVLLVLLGLLGPLDLPLLLVILDLLGLLVLLLLVASALLLAKLPPQLEGEHC